MMKKTFKATFNLHFNDDIESEMGLDRRYLDRRSKIKWIADRGSGTKIWIGDPRSKF